MTRLQSFVVSEEVQLAVKGGHIHTLPPPNLCVLELEARYAGNCGE
jgi:hypothetical protein